jgi:hypothetical protein
MDADVARDEKCIPVARAILSEMPTTLLADNIDPLVLSILQKALDTDMNITTEAQYVFQLLLGGFSGLNTTLHALALEPVDEVRYTTISNKILQILADSNVRLTGVKADEVEADWASAKVQLQELFTDEKLTKIDLDYIVEKIFTAVTVVNNKVSENLASSTSRAEAKVFGLTSMDEITVKHVNDVLVNDVSVMFSEPKLPDGSATPPAGDSSATPQ